MSNQDIFHYFGSFPGPDFPDNDFFNDIPVEPPLFHNVFDQTGRSVIHSSHPGLGRGRIPVMNPFLNRPIIDMSSPFFDPRLVNRIGGIRGVPARAAPPQPAPPPAANGRNRKRRASEKAISELKHMRLIDLKEDDDCCIICMEAFVDIKSSTDEPKRENALQMPCGHIFGSHCLKLWLKDHSTCPTCRKEVDFVEEDERGERLMAMNRRRNGTERQAAGLPIRHRHMQNRLVEVEVIFQRQRYTAPHMDPVAREHGADDAGWMAAGPHTPIQQFPHYSQYMGMSAFPNARVEGPMQSRHDPSARLPGVPAVHQALPRPQSYNHHPGVVNHRAAPQEMFIPGSAHAFQHRHQPHQPSTMPQRSQSQRQSQRQSQHQPYPEVNMANRGPVIPGAGSIDRGIYSPDLGNGPSGSSGVQAPGYIPPNPVNMQGNPQGAHPNQQQGPSLYVAGGVSLYPWDSGVRLQQEQHQQSQQTFIDPSSQMLNIQFSSSRRVCPATAAPPPLQPLQAQCDYTDMSLCQHQFGNSPSFSTGNITALPPDQTQIVRLGCGHGFHRICLLSTMKLGASRAARPAKWFCGKCGSYEDETRTIEEGQRTIGQVQHTID